MRAETAPAESAELVDPVQLADTAAETGAGLMPGGLPDFNPRQRDVLRALGRGLMTSGQYAQARTVFTALLHLDPAHTGDLAAAAEAFQAEGQSVQAASLLQVCLLLGGVDPGVPLRLAECHLALGNLPAVKIALNLAEEYAIKADDVSVLARIAIMRNGMAT